MLFFPLRSIAILLGVIMVSVVGCTDSVPSASSEPASQSTTTIIKTIGTTISQPATSIKITVTESPVKIFNGEYRWVEYRINNTITLPPNPRYQWEYAARIERSFEVYHGTPAVHEIISVTGDDSDWEDGILVTTKNGFHATEDTYFERSTKRFLGGTYTGSGGGLDNFKQTVPGDDTYREDYNWGWLLISPFEEMDHQLFPDGVESVTIPAGTFPNARKYSGKFHNLTSFPVTFWVSKGIPVPVQYRIHNPDLGGEDPVQTFELTGWG